MYACQDMVVLLLVPARNQRPHDRPRSAKCKRNAQQPPSHVAKRSRQGERVRATGAASERVHAGRIRGVAHAAPRPRLPHPPLSATPARAENARGLGSTRTWVR